MSYKNVVRLLITGLLSATLLTGCGDSPELKLQQAQIALANSKPDRALSLVDSVLKEQPDNIEAMWVKSRAEMLLAKLTASKRTLDKMIETHPDDVKVRRALVDWSWLRLRNLLTQSDFTTNDKHKEAFDKALQEGMDQAKWLEENGELADSGYYRARYLQLDSIRYQQLLQDHERSLSGVSLELDHQIREETDMERQQLERRMNDRIDDAEHELKGVIDTDPNHFKACEMYVGLLVQNEHWVDMWELAERYPANEPIPDTTAERIVSALVVMPTSIQPIDRRLERGWKILEAVRESDQESATWQTTASRLYIVTGDFEKAKPILQAALQKRPGDLDAQYFLAQSHFNLEEYDEAMEILKKLQKRASRSSRVKTLYGLTLMKQGNIVMAKEALRLATDLNPRDPMAREGFLALMAQEGHISEARGDVDAYYNLNPNDPRAIRFKMQFELANARQDEVEKLMKSVEKLIPLLPEHVAILVDGYMSLQQFKTAEKFGRQLVRNAPDSLRSHLKLAEALLMQGKDTEVKEMLASLRQQFPESASVDQMLGKLYLQRQSYDKAIDLLERVIAKNPSNSTARVLVAQAYASLVLTDEALEQIDFVLEQNPNDMRAHALAARIFQFTGQVEKANAHLDQIDDSRLDERTNPTLLAQLMLKRKNIDEALAICNRAVASGNTDPVLRLLLAAIYRLKENPTQVETHLLALVHQQPKNPQAFALLTRFYQEQKEIKKGLLEFQTLQRLNESLARLSQATLLAGVGQYEAGVLKLEPIYAPLVRSRDQAAMVVANALATLYEKQANLKAAAKVYQEMVDADFLAGRARLRQIEILSEMDGRDTSVERLDEIAKTLGPDQRRLGYQVMQRYANYGRPDKALEVAERWIKQQPNEPVLYRWRGELLLDLGRVEDAILAYSRAVELEPDSVGMRLRLSKAHIHNLDYAAAEATLREAADLDEGARISAVAAIGGMFVQLGLNQEAAKTFEELDRLSRPRDPRVLLTMGRALADLGRDSEATQRLEDIPKYASQYASAQILIGRIEQRQGNNDDARKRLVSLAKSKRYVAAAIRELADMKWHTRTEEDLLRWSDKAMNIKNLPPPLRFTWLGVRGRLAANDRDWPNVLETLEMMSDLQPNATQLVAARVLVLRRLNRIDSARDLFRITPELVSSVAGPLIAMGLGIEPGEIPENAHLPRYVKGMAEGDLDAARAAAEAIRPHKTIFRSDLLEIVDRPDAKSQDMANAFRELGVALIALDYCGLPQLAEDVCSQVSKRLPTLTPALSIGVDARLKQGHETQESLSFAKRAMPASSLMLYLNARQAVVDKNYETGVKALRKLIAREPANHHMRYYLTQMLQHAKDYDSTIEVLEEIYADEQDTYRTLAMNDLAYLLSEHHPDRLDEAAKIAEEAYERSPNLTVILDTLGWIRHLQGNDREAIKHLNRAAVGLSSLAEVHYHLGVVYNALGNQTWSKYHLKQAASGDDEDFGAQKARAMLGQE